MKRKLLYTLVLSGITSLVIAATTSLYPTKENGGNIPSNYEDVEFTVSDKNWARNVTLPKVALANAKIKIVNATSNYNFTLDLSNTDLANLASIIVKTGESLIFYFNNVDKIWEIQANTKFTSKSSGNTVPQFTGFSAEYNISNDSLLTEINLGQGTQNDQILVIRSDAAKETKLNTTNLLFPSSFIVNKGDRYLFKYNENLKKWVPLKVPTKVLQFNQSSPTSLATSLQSLKSPRTEIKLADGYWTANLSLPATANDRDRIIVSSTATTQTTISNTNINTQATLKINKGERYEFIYIAERNYWALVSSPRAMIKSNEVAVKLAQMKTPVTDIVISESDAVKNFSLPLTAQNDDKIIVSNEATTAATISAPNIYQTINYGEKIRFIYKNGKWEKDTVQIDTLLVNSPAVDEKLGATAAQIRMREGIRITNVSLEGSNGKAYYKEVGYYKFNPNSSTLRVALTDVTNSPELAEQRNKFKADAILYQGNETDPLACGWAMINVKPDIDNMVAVVNLVCGTNTMGHEFGHAMGIRHSWDRAAKVEEYNTKIANGQTAKPVGSNWGFDHELVSTLLGPRSVRLEYYSNPKIYDPIYGIRLGVENENDAIKTINENVTAISNFR